eukprot:CAMPEP_0167761774 /NCGR_PEP_ID=MMETSP0110_2-20121227/12368_1 /TAXON_ID=629695 /ORGANISM="Gymnochlora sp., Strain CCMP2014" /LENGTH=189 /DNA_ID=CAMNT_0007648513 /DNA_START=39 /DNA_END=608 /DNA_ORIENTATION=-
METKQDKKKNPRETELKKIFTLIDVDKSGVIEFKEILAAMACPEYDHISFMDAVKKFKEIDSSKDGVVQDSEFIKYFLAEFSSLSEKNFLEHMSTVEKFLQRKPALEKLFDILDKNKDGKLDEKEVQGMLQLPGEAKITGEQAFKVLKKMDTNKNGKVEKSELVRALFLETKNLPDAAFTKLMYIMANK